MIYRLDISTISGDFTETYVEVDNSGELHNYFCDWIESGFLDVLDALNKNYLLIPVARIDKITAVPYEEKDATKARKKQSYYFQ